MPYYIWDLKRDPNVENYPHGELWDVAEATGVSTGAATSWTLILEQCLERPWLWELFFRRGVSFEGAEQVTFNLFGAYIILL